MGLAATDRTVVVRGGEPVSLEIVLGEDAVALAPVLVLLERTRMVGTRRWRVRFRVRRT
jgi:hypothetical protein